MIKLDKFKRSIPKENSIVSTIWAFLWKYQTGQLISSEALKYKFCIAVFNLIKIDEW